MIHLLIISNKHFSAIPTDIPDPTHPCFMAEASEHIWKAIQASRGNAFVLFTSYTMLKTCYENLAGRLIEGKYAL